MTRPNPPRALYLLAGLAIWIAVIILFDRCGVALLRRLAPPPPDTYTPTVVVLPTAAAPTLVTVEAGSPVPHRRSSPIVIVPDPVLTAPAVTRVLPTATPIPTATAGPTRTPRPITEQEQKG